MYHQVVLDEEEEEGTIGISHTYYFCFFPPSRPCVGVGVLGTGDFFFLFAGTGACVLGAGLDLQAGVASSRYPNDGC